MSQNALKRFRKQWMYFMIIGLLILLSILLLGRRKKGWLKIFQNSEYKNYLPWLVAQSKHETGNWSSSLFKNHNSLFGFKESKRVEWNGYRGPVSPEGDYYAGYKSWVDSAQHYLNWLRFNNIPTDLNNVEDFVSAIRNKGFFTDTYDNYINGVKRFL